MQKEQYSDDNIHWIQCFIQGGGRHGPFRPLGDQFCPPGDSFRPPGEKTWIKH